MGNNGSSELGSDADVADVGEFTRKMTHRALADGIPLVEIMSAQSSVDDWSQWWDFWKGRAEYYTNAAERCLREGSVITAGDHYVVAAMCAHFGQFMYYKYPERKAEGVKLKIELYSKAAELFEVPAQPVEIEIGQGKTIPGYLRVPSSKLPLACAVVVGGLDSTKEDSHDLSQRLIRRGVATLTIDCPGQGEALERGLMLSHESYLSISRAIDFLESRPEIDSNRIGIVGRSLGGNLVAWAAAEDDRIRACVAWPGTYDFDNFLERKPISKVAYGRATGLGIEETFEVVKRMSLADVAQRITCPLYVVHGGKDTALPVYKSERLAQEASGPTTLEIDPTGLHCNHDRAFEYRSRIADWLTRELSD